MKLIESVPNFSEGRNFEKIDTIVHSLKRDGVSVLHIDSGVAANRTVVTVVGSQKDLMPALFDFVKTSSDLIDLRKHEGVHPFFGAVDVLPFVPLGTSTMEECIDCAKTLGKLVGDQLDIPVFLYGKAATHRQRAELNFLRRGGFDNLQQRMFTDPLMVPDFGPTTMHRTAGAIAIGARPILVAFNISLDTTSASIAQNIAELVRASGPQKKSLLKKHPAKCLPEIKAIGWYVTEYGCAQVSMNVCDYTVTSLQAAYESVNEVATAFGIKVRGSEIIGLVPESALILTGFDYGASNSDPKDRIIATAINKLGLNYHYPFEVSEKVIEKQLPTLNT